MATKSYTSEFTKSLGFGIGALVKGKKDYYFLEHLVGSHYHKAGEKQDIMLDEVIIGRNPDCHVRFDESFKTVSRHHASIIRDGDNWRLIQLSKTNTTFLNGKAIQDSWYLQSGDEIQLAINGPKLIFRIPTDKSGMSFTQRLDSFRDQVIRPYQTAFIVVCCTILMIIAGCVVGGVVIWKQHQNVEALKSINKEQRAQIDALYNELINTNAELAQTAILADSAQQEAIKAQSEAFRAQSEALKFKNKQAKTEKELQEVQEEMQQLKENMDNFYNGIIYGENQ